MLRFLVVGLVCWSVLLCVVVCAGMGLGYLSVAWCWYQYWYCANGFCCVVMFVSLAGLLILLLICCL
jgi:hypothetical protein